jgi:ComF family protein
MRLIHYVEKLSRWLLPFTCLFCHFPSQRPLDLCEPCHRQLPIIPHFCYRCAASLKDTNASLCEDCDRFPPPFDRTYALFSYEECIKRLILKLKFQQDLKNARLLGELLTSKIKQEWYQNKTLPSVIIPMPLHIKRLQERGFNQALEIARPISHILQLPIDTTSCERIKYTQPQAKLPAEKRLENIKNIFIIHKNFSHQHIAILDDVMTTGYTITELAYSLKNAGARQIDIWCCARAVLRNIRVNI